MLLVDGGAQITTTAPVVLASRDVMPRQAASVASSDIASLEPVSAVGTPTPPAPSGQSAFAFSLQIDQDTNRLIMKWSEWASGLVILQIPAKTAVQAFARINDPAPRGERLNGQA